MSKSESAVFYLEQAESCALKRSFSTLTLLSQELDASGHIFSELDMMFSVLQAFTDATGYEKGTYASLPEICVLSSTMGVNLCMIYLQTIWLLCLRHFLN